MPEGQFKQCPITPPLYMGQNGIILKAIHEGGLYISADDYLGFFGVFLVFFGGSLRFLGFLAFLGGFEGSWLFLVVLMVYFCFFEFGASCGLLVVFYVSW